MQMVICKFNPLLGFDTPNPHCRTGPASALLRLKQGVQIFCLPQIAGNFDHHVNLQKCFRIPLTDYFTVTADIKHPDMKTTLFSLARLAIILMKLKTGNLI